MSTRTLMLALLTIAASTLTACADATSPTRDASVIASTHSSLDVAPVCKTGGWNSSTGRCE
jgi:hypothetical protein